MTRPGPLLKLPKERRTEIAKKAIKARWDKELDRRMKRLLAKLDEQTDAAQPRPSVLRFHPPVWEARAHYGVTYERRQPGWRTAWAAGPNADRPEPAQAPADRWRSVVIRSLNRGGGSRVACRLLLTGYLPMPWTALVTLMEAEASRCEANNHHEAAILLREGARVIRLAESAKPKFFAGEQHVGKAVGEAIFGG